MLAIAEKTYVKELGNTLAKDIPELANNSDQYRVWTRAVYDALKKYSAVKGWKMIPEDRCYAGEYLCDFTIFDESYGCRIACESQWCHWGRDHQVQLDWAFDKLRGVKSDIKLFIFEGSKEQWRTTYERYLMNYAQLSIDEAFLALRWEKDGFTKSFWQPTKNGKQETDIQFEEF